ncbi:MAG: BamA/TamA family outer membrane protein [Bacteroidaceae bacterium]|nr:BamA/TamA family outer membrane protein [Bacteroidaceae bacterium]MCF0185921.1 BamA/TamA family outer membrane protein [Bacteroidaceae bacterium]
MVCNLLRSGFLLCVVGLLISCSTTKFVPEGEYLLDAVSLTSDNDLVEGGAFRRHVKQIPNAKWFSRFRVPLSIYSLSGRDSTKWINKVLRRMGEAPQVFSMADATKSAEDIRQAVTTYGYLKAQVDVETMFKRRNAKVIYHIHPNTIYKVSSIQKDIADPRIDSILRADSLSSLLYVGMDFNANTLSSERNRIANNLLDQGYYRFNKEFITFQADTIQGSYWVDLTLRIRNQIGLAGHDQYRVRRVDVYSTNSPRDSLRYAGCNIFYNEKVKLRARVLTQAIPFREGDLFSQSKMQKTYDNYNRLRALRYTNVRFTEMPEDSLGLWLQVYTDNNKFQSFSIEVEGTNSAGDLGAALVTTYSHRNIFKGSETFSVKLRGAYEAITGLEGYSRSDYVELGAEASLSFPRFIFPYAPHSFLQDSKAISEMSLQYNMQNRPEFRRRVASWIWRYRWNSRGNKQSNRFDVINLNFVYMPWISKTFKEKYLDNLDNYNAILKYNYENLLITKLGYSFTYNSQGLMGVTGSNMGTNSYTIRANIESSGNLLYGINSLVGSKGNKDGHYTVLNIAYAQYIKGDFDISKSIRFDEKNSLALHLGFGIAYPYGNSTILPFEKRYFSGGANSVRGWSVRTLGPGSYAGKDKGIDYINQSGDVKLDLNAEYRTHLFWKIDGAVFVDAGNIWTLRNYKDQPGGQFRFDKFYKQLAASYGIGFRLVFDYFILRFDGGMKAVNPVYTNNKEHFCFLHPDFSRDFTFHFAVGLPF